MGQTLVALRTEGVDRNQFTLIEALSVAPSPSARRAWIEMLSGTDCAARPMPSPSARRAWIEILCNDNGPGDDWSPSARRAWIEINQLHSLYCRRSVALRTEGVDRNYNAMENQSKTFTSPSARRAWIEMHLLTRITDGTTVALRTEGVDRNGLVDRLGVIAVGRPPHGGRG